MGFAAIQKDILKRLEIDPDDIYLKFKSLEGTRHIIQYENPDYVFTLSKTFKPKIECFGVTNRCADGKFVLFLDYDKIYKSLIYKNLNNLLKKFPKSLGNFYIATTEPEEVLEDGERKGSYHVVNFVKQFKYQIGEFLKYCDVDPFFLKIPEKTAHKCHVLRISEKYWKVNGTIIKERPKFLETYPKKVIKLDREESYAHYKFFKEHWRIEDPIVVHKFDNLTQIGIHHYSTPKGMEVRKND